MIEIQTSVGELFDKISILNIKKQKIIDAKKIKNIEKELITLSEKAETFKSLDEESFRNYMADLIEVNTKLWETEDRIRILEKNQTFNEEFIVLARDVYFNNDKRFEIKSSVNKFYNSEIIEEKQYEKYI
jgi:hypothetical protein